MMQGERLEHAVDPKASLPDRGKGKIPQEGDYSNLRTVISKIEFAKDALH